MLTVFTGDVFQVALYDSASEDDGSVVDHEVLMTLSDRFIQEIKLTGDVSDNDSVWCLGKVQCCS